MDGSDRNVQLKVGLTKPTDVKGTYYCLICKKCMVDGDIHIHNIDGEDCIIR